MHKANSTYHTRFSPAIVPTSQADKQPKQLMTQTQTTTAKETPRPTLRPPPTPNLPTRRPKEKSRPDPAEPSQNRRVSPWPWPSPPPPSPPQCTHARARVLPATPRNIHEGATRRTTTRTAGRFCHSRPLLLPRPFTRPRQNAVMRGPVREFVPIIPAGGGKCHSNVYPHISPRVSPETCGRIGR